MREDFVLLLDLLEEKINALVEKHKKDLQNLKECEKENVQLKKENLELKSMLETQSVRVDALLKKLEETLKDRQKSERGVPGEKNGNF